MASRTRIIGNQNITSGAVALGDTYGQVVSGTLTHAVDEEDVLDALGNVQAIVQRNERYEFTAETVWDETSTDPVMGDALTLPNSKVAIIQSAAWSWSNGGTKSFTITARHLLSLGDAPTKAYVTLV
jgi:hypothetical protein